MPPGDAAPIKVNFIEPQVAKNEDLATGRMEILPEPVEPAEPDDADILSNVSSRAASPEKGKKQQARKTAIPRKKVTPPAPAKTESKEDIPETRPDTPKTKVAALVDPARKTAPPDDTELRPHAPDVIEKKPETEKTAAFEKDDVRSKRESRVASVRMTDRPSPEPEEAIDPSGMTGAEGSELDEYAVSATDDVIEIGDEAVVSLSAKSFKYMDYFESVKRAVELAWSYPEEAIINGWSGKVMVKFTLNSSGQLEGVSLVKSTQHELLNEEAKNAVRLAAPYAPFPATLDKKRLHVVATFIYQPAFHIIR